MIATCDYCKLPAELVTGAEVYPHRPELADNQIWQCKPCGAWVGCHFGTTKPLGRLANAELRKAKMAAHAAFDPLWQKDSPKRMFGRRSDAYLWLSKRLGKAFAQTHIGMFDVSECQRVVEVCKEAA